jgi:hypothetical protein
MAQEPHRELDPLRAHRRGTSNRSAPACRRVRARRHLCIRSLGVERLRHPCLPHRHSARRGAGERYSTVPGVCPGGESLLRLASWPKVEKVLQAIDQVEALGIDPADAAPEYWRHVHNRLSVGEQPRPYTRSRHQAWLHRQAVSS